MLVYISVFDRYEILSIKTPSQDGDSLEQTNLGIRMLIY